MSTVCCGMLHSDATQCVEQGLQLGVQCSDARQWAVWAVGSEAHNLLNNQ